MPDARLIQPAHLWEGQLWSRQSEPGAVSVTLVMPWVRSEVIASRSAHLGGKVIQLSPWLPVSVRTVSPGEPFSVMGFLRPAAGDSLSPFLSSVRCL